MAACGDQELEGEKSSFLEEGKDVIYDSKGNRYVYVQEAEFEEGPIKVPSVDEDVPDFDPQALGTKELADILRPRMLVDGKEYILETPDEKLAEEIKNGLYDDVEAEPGYGELGKDEEWKEDPVEEEEEEKDEEKGLGADVRGIVIGADGRQYQNNNTQYPGRTFVWNEQGCTGKLIGPSTMLTAAHCLHSGKKWYSLPKFFPGPDANKSTKFPFGSYGCYSVTIPGGWGKSLPVAHDYAVVEFSRCKEYPGNKLGWLGLASKKNSWLDGRTTYLYGFPGDKRPNPAIWGMGGKISTSFWYPARLFYKIDTAGGQSGSGLYAFINGGRYVVGVHRGGYSSKENQARKVDGTVMGFVLKYSAVHL